MPATMSATLLDEQESEVLDAPVSPQSGQTVSQTVSQTFSQTVSTADELRQQTIGCKLALEKFGLYRALTGQQTGKAAETFDAEAGYLRARKKLIDSKAKEYQQVLSVLNTARSFWKSVTVPYPEAGVRLMRRDWIEKFEVEMEKYRTQLAGAISALESAQQRLIDDARERLGDLFNEHDYPKSFEGQFSLDWSYPATEPPAYLRELSPELYERESARIKAQFDLAVSMAESAFAQEFSSLVERLAERLAPGDDAKPKVLRASAVDNFNEFFQKFAGLNVKTSSELNALIAQCQQLISGASVKDLRSDVFLRDKIAQGLGGIKEQLAGFVEVKGRRFALENEEAS